MKLTGILPDAPRFTHEMRIPANGEAILSWRFDKWWWGDTWGRAAPWVSRWRDTEANLLREMREAVL